MGIKFEIGVNYKVVTFDGFKFNGVYMGDYILEPSQVEQYPNGVAKFMGRTCHLMPYEQIASATPAKTKPIKEKLPMVHICQRCGGTGKYLHYGECYGCGGSGKIVK
jgi:hypothetical protein